METILITGGTGLIGSRITDLAIEAGYKVAILSRSNRKSERYDCYKWDVEEGWIDEEAILQADHIIHLAGAGVADKPWTKSRKKIIYDSRIDSTKLLHDHLSSLDHKVQSFISTSAVGYYGDRGNELVDETTESGDDFLAGVCKDWEKEADRIATLGIRTVKLRVGLVMSMEGGALQKIAQTLPFGVLSYFGDGSMYNPWIHLNDMARMYLYALQTESMKGVYNGAAPKPVTNKKLVEQVKESSGKMAIIVPAPSFALKLALGELSSALLSSCNADTEKIQQAGFKFTFPEIKSAFDDLLT